MKVSFIQCSKKYLITNVKFNVQIKNHRKLKGIHLTPLVRLTIFYCFKFFLTKNSVHLKNKLPIIIIVIKIIIRKGGKRKEKKGKKEE